MRMRMTNDHEGLVSSEGRTFTNLRILNDINAYSVAGSENELASLANHASKHSGTPTSTFGLEAGVHDALL